jgi:hypothetical protein
MSSCGRGGVARESHNVVVSPRSFLEDHGHTGAEHDHHDHNHGMCDLYELKTVFPLFSWYLYCCFFSTAKHSDDLEHHRQARRSQS